MLQFLAEVVRAVFAFALLALVYPTSKSSSPTPTKPSPPPRKVDRAYLGACLLVVCGIVAVIDTNAPQFVMNDANSVLHESLHRQCYDGVWHRLSVEEQRVATKEYGFYCSFGDVLFSMTKASSWMAATSHNPVMKVAVLFALPTQLFDAAAKMLVSGKPEVSWEGSETQKYWHPGDHVYVFMLVWTFALVVGFVDKHAQVLVKFCRSSSVSWNLRTFVVQQQTVPLPKAVETVPTSSPKTSPMVEKKSPQKQILWWKWQ